MQLMNYWMNSTSRSFFYKQMLTVSILLVGELNPQSLPPSLPNPSNLLYISQMLVGGVEPTTCPSLPFHFETHDHIKKTLLYGREIFRRFKLL